jgi:hypothetical protein
VLTAAIAIGALAGDPGCAFALVVAVVMLMAAEVR